MSIAEFFTGWFWFYAVGVAGIVVFVQWDNRRTVRRELLERRARRRHPTGVAR